MTEQFCEICHAPKSQASPSCEAAKYHVAPAPTASAREWLNELLMCVGEAWSDYGFNGDIYRHVWTDRKKAEEILEAYASSQSEKLKGVGQQAAEEIRKYVKATGLRASSRTAADIIDRVIAGRVKP